MKRKLFFPIMSIIFLLFSVYYSGGINWQPIFGTGDLAIWEFMESFFSKNVDLFPIPSIDFESNSTFYPYGTSNVFQDWSAERELFNLLFNYTLGFDNALYLYYILSLLISALGPFFLFKKQFGKNRAAIVGFVIAFFNFYAHAKFPGHYNMSTVHWTSLSVCIDYLIIYKLVGKERITLELILLRALILILSVGQSLGYVAGYALLSFSLMIFVATIVFLVQFLRKSYKIGDFISSWKKDYLSNKRLHLILLSLIFVFTFLYVPIDLCIYSSIKKFESVQQFPLWASPLRALIPWTPWLNPSNLDPSWLEFFGSENPEGGNVANSPGYFLLLCGIVGMIFSQRRMALIFLLSLFVISLTNHPYEPYSISNLPWLEFARVGSRISILFAPVLGVFLLSFPIEKLKKNHVVKVIALILVCLGGLELYTFKSLHKYKPQPISEEFYSYMKYISDTPGEAIFDWPFCVAGGNGYGTDKLGPYYNRNSYIPYMSKYHNKKVMGLYAGRLTPKQIEPYMIAGFQKIFSPETPNYFVAKRQNRPMTKEEWQFLDEFFTYNDFAGINLYTDLIYPGDDQLFYSRFGQAQKSIQLPRVGNVSFIPKDQKRNSKENIELGKSIMFLPTLTKTASLKNGSKEITVVGFDKGNNENGIIYGVKNGSYINFRTDSNKSIRISVRGGKYQPDISFEILLNGQSLSFDGAYLNATSQHGTNKLEIVSNGPDYVAAIEEIHIQIVN